MAWVPWGMPAGIWDLPALDRALQRTQALGVLMGFTCWEECCLCAVSPKYQMSTQTGSWAGWSRPEVICHNPRSLDGYDLRDVTSSLPPEACVPVTSSDLVSYSRWADTTSAGRRVCAVCNAGCRWTETRRKALEFRTLGRACLHCGALATQKLVGHPSAALLAVPVPGHAGI